MEKRLKTKSDLMNSQRAKREMRVEDRQPLKEKLKAVAREVGEFSLFAGMSSTIRSELPVKVMWIFFQLGLLGVFIYLAVNNIRNYLKHEVVTKVREINEFPSYFPAITVCNLIYFQTEYSKEFMMGIADFYGLPNIFNSSEYNASDFATLLQKYDQLGSAVVVEQNLNKTEIQKFGYSIDEMLINCQFNQFTCNSSEFAWFFHPEYGNCYQFNVGKDSDGNKIKPKTILRPGNNGGLSMEVFVGVSKALETLTLDFGLAVFVHSVTTSPLSVQPITIYPNAESNIVISRLVNKKEPKPYSECQELESVKSEIKEKIIKKGIDYYQQDCIIQCYQQKIIDECHCYDIQFVSYLDWNVPCIPTNKTQISCYQPIYQEFLSEEFIRAECMPKCPLECKRTEYKTSISTNGYPTIPYENALTNLIDLYNSSDFSRSLRYNILKLNVYYDKLSFDQVAEEPAIDVITLVSNIGGSLGLMLGVSFATMVELFELSLKSLIVLIRHWRAMKRVAVERRKSDNNNKNKRAEVLNENRV